MIQEVAQTVLTLEMTDMKTDDFDREDEIADFRQYNADSDMITHEKTCQYIDFEGDDVDVLPWHMFKLRTKFFWSVKDE